ncbi:MAG: UDP-N-acetylglucosamine 2-epimerase, partial [Syntrophomonas sp.]
MRKVLYISGSRADYGPMRGVLQAIRSAPGLSLNVLVTGMHLDPLHGESWQEIAADGFNIVDRVYGRATGDSLKAMAASLGLYLYGMCEAIESAKPDIVMVLGDRGEQLAAAIAAAVQNIVVVHVAGGSISGSIDDSIRHAITKFAHYHLPASAKHARRIVQMGEEPSRVHAVGLPGGDIRPDVIYTRSEICEQLDLPVEKPYLLLIQHSVTHSQSEAARQITETLEAVAGAGYPTLLANPNDDAGGRVILSAMQKYARRYDHLHVLQPPNNRKKFASIMAHSAALLGNSSSGIAEAMSVQLPVINIGGRQRGR